MKIGFFITARLKSERLRYKILLDLRGKSALDHIIERCQTVQGIDGVVLCTSTNPQDAILYEHALKYGIQFYAGSEEDVLNRLLSAATYFGYDAFLSITADNPLFSIHIAQVMLDWYKQEQLDYMNSKNSIPLGLSPHLLDVNALKIVDFMKKETNTEIWGPFINRSDFFKVGEIEVLNCPYHSDKRITLDYPEDYNLILEIYNHFPVGYKPRIQEIINLFKKKPELWEINGNRRQHLLDASIVDSINKYFDGKMNEGRAYAAQIGKTLQPGFHRQQIEI